MFLIEEEILTCNFKGKLLCNIFKYAFKLKFSRLINKIANRKELFFKPKVRLYWATNNASDMEQGFVHTHTYTHAHTHTYTHTHIHTHTYIRVSSVLFFPILHQNSYFFLFFSSFFDFHITFFLKS